MNESEAAPDSHDSPGENPFGQQEPASPATAIPSLENGSVSLGIGIALLILFAVVNCAAVPFGEQISGPPDDGWAILLAMGMGLIGGQIGALSGVLVWINRPFLYRLMMLWLLGLALYGCWFLGLLTQISSRLWFRDMMLEVARAILASLPLISLSIQMPQWIVRLYFGWRIVNSNSVAADQPRQPLSIRDILIGTTVAALTVTAIRISLTDSAEMTTGFWVAWAIAVVVLCIVSTAVNLPMLFLILRGHHPAWAISYIVLGSPVIVGTLIAGIAFLEPGPGGPDSAIVLIFLLMGTTCVATTSAPMWLARVAGYRLKIGREL